MTLRALAPVLFAAVLLPVAAHAQVPSTTYFIGAGPAVPVGGQFDSHGTGWNVGGGFETPEGRSTNVRIELAYHRFPLDEAEFRRQAGVPADPDVEVEGGDIWTVSGLLALKYRLSAADAVVRPYVLAGAGYWRRVRKEFVVRDGTDTEMLEEDMDEGVAGALAAGADWPIAGGVALFVEARVMLPWNIGDRFNTDETLAPLRFGIAIMP